MRIKLSDHLDVITLDVERGDKKDIMENLVALVLPGETETRRDEALSLVMQREALGTTAIGGGLALPHADVGFLRKSRIVLAIFKEGVDFDSADGEPVYAVFLMLGPPSNQVFHLQILARVARLFKHIDLPDDIAGFDTPDSAAEFIEKIEEAHS